MNPLKISTGIQAPNSTFSCSIFGDPQSHFSAENCPKLNIDGVFFFFFHYYFPLT